jgi:NAD(P)-dependent dehydrogenase (short-subunit alcohol dehydrogenase family)
LEHLEIQSTRIRSRLITIPLIGEASVLVAHIHNELTVCLVPRMALAGLVFGVTGGASGIGFATAQILSTRGATVCIADVDPEAMKRAEDYFSPLNVPYTVTKVDISKRQEVESWIDGIIEKFGKLDGAANVAGVIGKHHGVREVKDLDDDEWNRIIAVNLTGTMLVWLLLLACDKDGSNHINRYCMRAELQKISDGGSIVNVSSIHGLKGIEEPLGVGDLTGG